MNSPRQTLPGLFLPRTPKAASLTATTKPTPDGALKGKRNKKNPGPLALGCLFTPKIVARNLTRTKVVQRGGTGATKWHQVQINLYCTKYTGGCTAQACDGFLPITGSPQWNPKPRCAPPSPGLHL